MKDPNEVVFTRARLESAMATNCSYYHGMSVQDRFELETKILMEALDPHLNGVHTVMDFGLGVGRVSKAILDKYPNVRIIGVDNSQSMIEHSKEYIPPRYFNNGRIDCVSIDEMQKIAPTSVDLILGIYVLQHVDSTLISGIFDQWSKVLKDEGELYVLNSKGRGVPKQDRFGLYNSLRKVFRFFEYHCDHKQIQRLSIKLDNKSLFHDDGIDIQKELATRYNTFKDIPLNGHPHIERLMRNHFSRVYTKRKG